ncbi:flavin reductase family protein [Rhodococcus sp. 06-235-1A]|uniref:flavin reductase family protein n=1 Tax=Rhodococcus sp. 06-235-1A TaxID=2022508 RepID=UPI0035942C61
MSNYATGVALITAGGPGQDCGFAVNSLTSVSLSPTMLLFCPARSSSSWATIASIGSFCVSLLAADQERVARTFSARCDDRFACSTWTRTPMGHPALADGLAWIECSVRSVHIAGDHDVVIAEATAWHCDLGDSDPLIFFAGQYRQIHADQR